MGVKLIKTRDLFASVYGCISKTYSMSGGVFVS